MHWYSVPPLLVNTAIALAIAYSCASAIALLRLPRGTRVTFIKDHALNAAAAVIAIIPGAAFVSLFIWALLFFVLKSAFGFANTEANRFSLFTWVYVCVLAVSILYLVRSLWSESSQILLGGPNHSSKRTSEKPRAA